MMLRLILLPTDINNDNSFKKNDLFNVSNVVK